MSWHYCIRKKVVENKPWYDIVEFYDSSSGQSWWAEDSVAPSSETRKGLLEVLEMMLKDAKHYKTLVDL